MYNKSKLNMYQTSEWLDAGDSKIPVAPDSWFQQDDPLPFHLVFWSARMQHWGCQNRLQITGPS